MNELPRRPMILLSLLSALLASGCASQAPRDDPGDLRDGKLRSYESYYGRIDSIRAGSRGEAAAPLGAAGSQPEIYVIRVRFDDRRYETVAQSGLDGLRVGDSVRIEGLRLRRY